MVAADADEVVVAHVVVHVELRHVAHHLERGVEVEDQGVLPHRLLELVGLHRASDCGQGRRPYIGGLLVRRLPAVILGEPAGLLPDCHVEEGGQVPPVVAVDGHADRGVGGAQVEALEEPVHLVNRADADPGLADLSEYVQPLLRVVPVEAR